MIAKELSEEQHMAVAHGESLLVMLVTHGVYKEIQNHI